MLVSRLGFEVQTMTEVEWLASDNPKAMVDWLTTLRRRTIQLFACSCCRRLWKVFALPRQQAIEVAELFADAMVDSGEFNKVRLMASEYLTPRIEGEGIEAETSVRAMLSLLDPHSDKRSTVFDISSWAASATNDVPGEWKAQGILFRDIFGNPFRPVALDPSWQTSTVTDIACGMYDSRDFSVMPILADALQDAGCDNDDILTHCRDTNAVHVRGCWVVDLVLGKT
jgi:hypothetical protein